MVKDKYKFYINFLKKGFCAFSAFEKTKIKIST